MFQRDNMYAKVVVLVQWYILCDVKYKFFTWASWKEFEAKMHKFGEIKCEIKIQLINFCIMIFVSHLVKLSKCVTFSKKCLDFGWG